MAYRSSILRAIHQAVTAKVFNRAFARRGECLR